MKRPLPLTLTLLALGIAWAGVPARVAERGWRPLVRLAGDGDPALAPLREQPGFADLFED